MLAPRGARLERRDGDHRLVGMVAELVPDGTEHERLQPVEAVRADQDQARVEPSTGAASAFGRACGLQGGRTPSISAATTSITTATAVTINGSSTVELRSASNGRLLHRPSLGAAPCYRSVWFSNWNSGSLTAVDAGS